MDKKKFRKIFGITLWSFFLIPIISAFVYFSLVSSGKIGYMPEWDELENPDLNLASELFADDTIVIGRYFYENRSLVKFENLSPYLIDALVCTEDIRYFKHSGIDFRGTVRAIVKGGILGNEAAGGGSTISQQLAKLLYTKTSKNKFERGKQKLNEWVIATRLERRYTKAEIISLYLNKFDFLNNSIGIRSASKVYFNATPDSLTVSQAAMLVGMLKNPSLFNPLRFEEKTMGRRDQVLLQMNKYGRLSNEALDTLIAMPLNVSFTPERHSDGMARYLYANIRNTMTHKIPQRRNYYLYHDFKVDSLRWLNDPFYGWCNKNFKPDGTPYNIYTDGLKIYSTINYNYQLYAEAAVKEHLSKDLQPAFFREKKGRTKAPFSDDLTNAQIQGIMDRAIRESERYRVLKLAGKSKQEIRESFKKPVEMNVFTWDGPKDTVLSPIDSIKYYKHFLRTGFISMDPHNGHVKAYVGGIDFKQFKFDHVTSNSRQVGSTIKPFLYTLAMQEGFTPCHEVPNVPVEFPVGDTTWKPKNSGNPRWENQMVTLRFGLAHSINYITAWVLNQFNPQAVVDMAHKLGVKSFIDPVYSVVLGTSGISPEEMVNAYCVYANKGIHQDPIYVTRIEDKNGNVIATFESKPTEVINEETAYLMLNLMQGVVEGGTAGRLRWRYGFEIPIAGKTGTTQNHSDGWFIGITPDLVSGGWVGAEDPSVHFDYIGMGQGAQMSLPIWAHYMRKIVDNDTTGVFNDSEFIEPEGFDVELNCDHSTNTGTQNEDEDLDINLGW